MHLTITNVSKSYGVHQILDDISLTLGAQQRIGLVGPNGVGKSTLLKIIVGEIEADSATIALPPQARVGYLPQVITDYGDKTLDEMIADSMAHIHTLEAQMRELEVQMSWLEGGALEAVLQTYGEVTERFEFYGGYEIDYRVDVVLAGLQVDHIERRRSFVTLSGGEKARVGLAMLLLQSPDLLLLDEPTNHLDFASLEWLEDYLRSYRGAVMIVSHDRHFLNRTVTSIIEIEEHSRQARHYSGDYDAYLETKRHERRQWKEDYERQQEEIKALQQQIKVSARQVAHNRLPTDSDKYLKHHKRGRVEGLISRQVRNAEERLSRIEADPIPAPPEELRFDADFDPATLRGHTLLTVSRLCKRYDDRDVLREISFTLGPRSRVVLVGPNGCGKSTLLRLLVSLEQPDSGEVIVNPQVRLGYLDQEQETLDPDQTVFDVYRAGLPGHEQQHKAILLSTGLFCYDEITRRIGDLSSGQKRKLQIARIMAERANLLLLDEPTNYISFDVLESLEAALHEFPGPIIAATHDRRFLQRFGQEVWELRDGELVRYLGGYEEYVAAQMKFDELAALSH